MARDALSPTVERGRIYLKTHTGVTVLLSPDHPSYVSVLVGLPPQLLSAFSRKRVFTRGTYQRYVEWLIGPT